MLSLRIKTIAQHRHSISPKQLLQATCTIVEHQHREQTLCDNSFNKSCPLHVFCLTTYSFLNLFGLCSRYSIFMVDNANVMTCLELIRQRTLKMSCFSPLGQMLLSVPPRKMNDADFMFSFENYFYL